MQCLLCVTCLYETYFFICLQIVSYPDDNMQDPAKPKTSAVSWKNESDWTNNENIVTLHSFSSVNNDNAKYVSEDSKTSMDDVNMNDENCMYKEDRDANFNMESSSSSESCQSMKDMCTKPENDSVPSIVSSTTATNPPINSTSTTITHSSRPSGKKAKLGKESNRCLFILYYYCSVFTNRQKIRTADGLERNVVSTVLSLLCYWLYCASMRNPYLF